MNQIPKRIYYVWGANEKKKRDVELCIYSWKKYLKDYEIIEINEESTEYFNFKQELENNKWFKTVYENKLYAYISDYIRIKTLYDNGGIYLDTDVSVIKDFDEYLDNPAFVGIQNDSINSAENLEPAILGAQKNNEILRQVLEFYNEEIWNSPIFNMPQIFGYIVDKNYGKIYYPPKSEQKIIKLKDLTIYPEKYFIPMRYGTDFDMSCIENETTTVHWYNGSWVKDNICYFLNNKHKMPLEKLVNMTLKKNVYFDNKFIYLDKIYKTFNLKLDFLYLFKFRHKFYDKERYLTVFILGKQIKLWKR